MMHDSHNKFYRKPFGAVPAGTETRLRIRVSTKLKGCRVYLRLWINGCSEEKIYMNQDMRDVEFITYAAKFNVPEKTGLLWYYFIIETENKIYYYGNNYNLISYFVSS
jgi:4-alpha-glucanotransferase